MKHTDTFKNALLLSAFLLCLYGCGKSSSTPTPTTPTVPTTTDLLVSKPWNIQYLTFNNATTLTPYGVSIPDSLQNLVLTFNADNTFTETGGKTASGTWAFDIQLENTLTLNTTSARASTINWTYGVSATALDLSNNTLAVTPLIRSSTTRVKD